MTLVKFCGCTSAAEATLAVEAGADAVGFILAPSPRRVDAATARAIAAALPATVRPVGVFVDPTREELVRLRDAIPTVTIQLSGNEAPELAASFDAIKALHVGDETLDDLRALAERYSEATLLFDTRHPTLAGGTGRSFAWERVSPLVRARRAWIAGGLNPENVALCVRTLRPYGVDVRGGVESDGTKDRLKMRAFVRAVKETDAT